MTKCSLKNKKERGTRIICIILWGASSEEERLASPLTSEEWTLTHSDITGRALSYFSFHSNLHKPLFNLKFLLRHVLCVSLSALSAGNKTHVTRWMHAAKYKSNASRFERVGAEMPMRCYAWYVFSLFEVSKEVVIVISMGSSIPHWQQFVKLFFVYFTSLF